MSREKRRLIDNQSKKDAKLEGGQLVGRNYLSPQEKVYLEGIDAHLNLIQEAYGDLRTLPDGEFIDELDMRDDGNSSNDSFVFNYRKPQLFGNISNHLAPEDEMVHTSQVEELASLGMHVTPDPNVDYTHVNDFE